MTGPEALDIAARWALYWAVEAWVETGWESYFPEVGEFDYDRIVARMNELLPPDVTLAEQAAALDYLADRAEQ